MLVCANQLFYLIDSYIISIESLIKLKYFCGKGKCFVESSLIKSEHLVKQKQMKGVT